MNRGQTMNQIEFGNLKPGDEFILNDKSWVKTEEKKYDIGDWGMVTNCILLQEPLSVFDPPRFLSEFLLEKTLVWIENSLLHKKLAEKACPSA